MGYEFLYYTHPQNTKNLIKWLDTRRHLLNSLHEYAVVGEQTCTHEFSLSLTGQLQCASDMYR